MLEEYLARAIIAERSEELARHRLGQAALRTTAAPSLLRWLAAYAFEPVLNPRRARRPASTAGHSAAKIEKYAESRRVPSAPGE